MRRRETRRLDGTGRWCMGLSGRVAGRTGARKPTDEDDCSSSVMLCLVTAPCQKRPNGEIIWPQCQQITMPISKIDLNSTSKEQLKSLIDENSDQQVECPIEKRHVVKIEHIEAHVSDCLRVRNEQCTLS